MSAQTVCADRGRDIASRHGQEHQPVSLLRQLAGGDPDRGDDVREIPAVSPERGRPSGRARHRHLLRDCAAVVEPLRSDVRRRDPSKARAADAVLHALAMASRRGLRENQWRDALPLARRGPGRRGAGILCQQDQGQGGGADVHEEDHEAARSREGHHDRRAAFLQGRHEGHRQRLETGDRTLGQQQGGELTPALPTTRAGHGEVQADEDAAEVQLRPRRPPQPLQPRSPPHQPRDIQSPTLGRPGRVEDARRIGLASPARTPLSGDELALD